MRQSMRRIPGFTKMLLMAIAASTALACSGSDVSYVMTDEGSLPPSREEQEAEFQQLHEAELSQDEMMAAEARLTEMGVEMSEVVFSGRMVVIGDAYVAVDDLLGSTPDGMVEKGRTFGAVLDTPSIDGAPLAPTLFSRFSGGAYQWMRPDIQNLRIVVPNGQSFLVNLFQTARSNIVNAASDCLTTINVHTQAQYDALPNNDKIRSKTILVRFGTNVCPGAGISTNACALFPRNQTRVFEPGAPSETRLVPGTLVGVLSNRINTNISNGQTCTSGQATCNANNAAILTHELLHALGLAHVFDNSNGLVVIETSSDRFQTSIMQNFCVPGPNCIFPTTPTADDIDTIDTLFSPQASQLYPGGDFCQYVPGLKTIRAND
jgi:hypothetical protein